MDTIIHADIFFFVSTIALTIIAVAILVALVYFIKIMNDFRRISTKFRQEVEEIIEDVHHFRGRFGGFLGRRRKKN